MTSIKIKFRPSTTKEDEGTLFIQVIHNRLVRQIKTSYRIHSHEWDERNSRIRVIQTSGERKEYLTETETAVARMTGQVRSSIRFLETKGSRYTTDDILRTYHSYTERCLFPFMEQTVEYLRLIGKARTSETYATTLRSFKRFRNGEDVEITLMDSDLIQAYESHLHQRGVCPNTISFYMRILQAVYNRAVEKEITVQRFLFRHVSTRTEKTVKRAIGIKEIKRIRELELSRFPAMAFARDMFLFSFYTRGMSFVDMAYLKKTDLNGGMLSYRRKKTRQQLYIKWEDCMQEIVDKYALQTVGSPYLLPVIRKPGEEERKQYKAAIFTVNTNLKKVGKLAGITTNLTTYVARHSWASIAKSKNIPVSVISEGMGHESESTTQIYLASLDNQTIDNANRLVLSGL